MPQYPESQNPGDPGPDDLTQPIPADATVEQPPLGPDAASPADPSPADPSPAEGAAAVPVAAPASPPPAPAWAAATHEGDGAASARPVPVPGQQIHNPTAPATPAQPVVTAGAPVAARKTWRSRLSGGRGLAVGALVVGLGLGAVGGSVATWAVVHDNGAGTTADGRPGFPDGDGDFGPPGGGRGGMPPGDGQIPNQQQGGGGTDGQLPGGGAGTNDGTDGSTNDGTDGSTNDGSTNDGTDGSTNDSGTDANGTSQGT